MSEAVSPKKGRSLLIVAGEASGDLHGARLLTALRSRTESFDAFGLGGDELEAAGVDRVADSAEISVVGITEVLKILKRARQIFGALLEEVDRRRPVAAILVDFPEFNLRLARQLHRRGVPVFYYVSPQIWAWRRGRVKTVARVVDTMLLLFPFEEDFYRGHGVNAVHVGHPLIDEVPVLPQIWDREQADPEPLRIALLPGSRRSEVDVLLPPMLGAVEIMARSRPVEVRLIRAPSVPRAYLEKRLEERLGERSSEAAPSSQSQLSLTWVEEGRHEAIAESHFAFCASGTATLEVGLLGTPMVVVYRLAFWTYWAARWLVKLPWVSLVNLVLDRGTVPELIQGDARAERLAAEATAILEDPQRRQVMRQELAEVRTRLGAAGASERAADAVAEAMRRRGL